MSGLRRCTPLALVLLALTLPAHAQATDKAARPGRFRLGPLWLTPKLVLRNAGVDNNVYNANGDTPTVSDRQAALTPGVDLLLPIGSRLRVSAVGTLGLNWFQREESEKSTDLNGQGRAEFDLGPLTVFGTGAAGRHRQRFSVEIDQRLERSSRSRGGGLRWRVTRRLGLAGEGSWQRYRFEQGVQVRGQSVKSALDRDTRVLSGQFTYALSPRTDFLATADLLEDSFPSTLSSAGTDEVRSARFLAGLSFNRGALLSGSLRAGLRRFPRRAGQNAPEYSGLGLAANLGLPIGARARLSLNANRDVNYAVAAGQDERGTRRNTYVSELYGGQLDFELPLSLVARGLLSHERADYLLPQAVAPGAAALERQDDVTTWGGALLRAFGKSLRVGVNVERARRSSNLGGFGYQRTSYGLTAEYLP
jgi:hypothetical protein